MVATATGDEQDMGVLGAVGRWLVASNRDPSGTEGHDLQRIDVPRLVKQLGLLEEAKRLGEAGIPSASARTPVGAEAEVINRVEKLRQQYVQWAVRRLGVLNEDISRLSVTQEVNRARQADQEFERNASTLLSEKSALLLSLDASARKRRAELEKFKLQNQLTREAQYPDFMGLCIRYLWLALFIVGEGVLNAKFFSEGLEGGLIEGALTAMILAAANVLSAYFIGLLVVRQINHVNPVNRSFGALGLLVAILLIITLALGISHYRDALTAEMEYPAKAALDAFQANPFQLHDVFSWVLLFITFFVGLGAIFDGLKCDDAYPRYGSISRHAHQAQEEYDAELELIQNDLQELKENELKSLDIIANKCEATIVSLSSTIRDKEAAKLKLSSALTDADGALKSLLHAFRTANEEFRSGLPIPAYFDALPELQTLDLPDFDTTIDKTKLVNQRRLVDALIRELQDIRGKIQAAFNVQFESLKPLGSHFTDVGNK
jgi:hypothetical protein